MTTTDTSREAYASIKPVTSRIERTILEWFRLNGEGTCEQVEKGLNMAHQTISGRITKLRDSGRIIDTGKRRRNESGRNAIVWREALPIELMNAPTPEQKRAASQRCAKQWQDIASAPAYVRVLVFSNKRLDNKVATATTYDFGKTWEWDRPEFGCPVPDCWQHLPTPPKDKK